MKTLTCTCGKISSEYKEGNLGDIRAQTAFVPIFSNTGAIHWLCDDCYEKVHQLALEIHEIVKDDFLHFGSLLKVR